MSRGKNAKKVISLEVIVVDGDAQRSRDDTPIDLKVSRDSTLARIDDAITNILCENDTKEDHSANLPNLQYYHWSPEDGSGTKDREPLDMDRTLAQLNINEGDRLIAESGSKRRKRSRKSLSDFDRNTVDDDDTLSLVCTTRIFENEGWAVRKVRVQVKKQQHCSYLMDDITSLWNRSGLKFRYGRTVLNANKTFEDLGIHKDGEVVITGARTT
jgi:hypothetical protein